MFDFKTKSKCFEILKRHISIEDYNRFYNIIITIIPRDF